MECSIFGSAWVADDDARTLARIVREALDATVTRGDALDRMRLANEAQLSEQLNCQKPLNLFRLSGLPESFWDDFQSRLAQLRGGLYLPPSVVLVLKGAAALGPHRQLRMALPTPSPKAKVS